MLQSRKKKHLKEAHKISNKSSCLYYTLKTKKERILVCSSRFFFFLFLFFKSKELLACTSKCIPFSNLIVLRFLNQPHFPQNTTRLAPLRKSLFLPFSILIHKSYGLKHRLFSTSDLMENVSSLTSTLTLLTAFIKLLSLIIVC